MDQPPQRWSSASRAYQFHPSSAVINDLFNLYLVRNSHHRADDSVREPPNKAQKHVVDLPPQNDQFIVDFQQLQNQFADRDQLRSMTESVLISLVVQCSGHAPRAEFLLFALRSLCGIGYINWDTFLPSLLSSVSPAELSVGQGSQSMPVVSPTSLSQSERDSVVSSLRQLCCKIILIGLDFNLKPVTHSDIFSHMLNWLVNWDQGQHRMDESDVIMSWRPDKALIEWLHSCLDVIWLLVEEDKCRVPFYELLRSGLQFIENIPDDEALFTLILEIHRRRDMMAMHMQMLDQHLHCPTFGTERILTLITPNVSGEAVGNLRYSPITYPSVLGEPLNGEELATSKVRGSLDWERALRCIRHAIRTAPSPDWWKRVLLVAPCYGPSGQPPTPGAVFTSEMICEATIDRIIELLKLTNSDINCWSEWLIFSDIFYFLMKSGCIDFLILWTN